MLPSSASDLERVEGFGLYIFHKSTAHQEKILQVHPIMRVARKTKNPTDKALDEFAEKVTIEGLKEAFEEHILWIRHIFKIALLVSCSFVFYLTYRDVILVALNRPITTGIRDVVDLENLPMPNIMVCIEYCANGTFIKETVSIPDDLMKTIQNRIGLNKTKFIDEYARYLAVGCRSREFKSSKTRLFRMLYAFDAGKKDFTAQIRLALPSCKKMFKRCKFNHITFDCCKNALNLIMGDGLCYQLGVRFSF